MAMQTSSDQDLTRGEMDALADVLYGPLSVYASTFCKVKSKSGKIKWFDFNIPQVYLDKRIEEHKQRNKGKVRVLIPKARQMGVSTYVQCRGYRKTTTGEGIKTFILTHEDDATTKLFGVAKTIHDHFPPELKVAASNDAADMLNFRSINGEYALATARTKARGRGDTVQYFHGSEVAFWPNAEQHVDGVFQAIADEPGTEMLLESTGQGPIGLFYEYVQASLRGLNDYEVIFLPWTIAEEYRVDKETLEEWEDWEAPHKWVEYAELFELERDQLIWAYRRNVDLAVASRKDPDDGPCWKFRAEYPIILADAFIIGDEDALISSEAIYAARKDTTVTPESQDSAALVVGLDIARGGSDKTEFMSRRGRLAGEIQKTMNTRDTMAIVGQAQRVFLDNPDVDMMFIDTTGVGGPVYDRLVEAGYGHKCRPVNFGETALNERRFPNRRCEMWGNMSDWMADPGAKSIPDDDILQADLGGPHYKWDSNGRLVVEKKEDMKSRLKFSPDKGDALALTFAEPVVKPETVKRTTEERVGHRRRQGRRTRRPGIVG